MYIRLSTILSSTLLIRSACTAGCLQSCLLLYLSGKHTTGWLSCHLLNWSGQYSRIATSYVFYSIDQVIIYNILATLLSSTLLIRSVYTTDCLQSCLLLYWSGQHTTGWLQSCLLIFWAGQHILQAGYTPVFYFIDQVTCTTGWLQSYLLLYWSGQYIQQAGYNPFY